jgi:uncharacterized protein YkwD
LRPGFPAAAKYGSASGVALGARLRLDPFRVAIVDEIRRLAREARRPEPVDDERLNAVAWDLARGLHGMDLPPFETVDFLLGHYGLVEAAPNLLLARASADAGREVREQMAGQIAAVLKTSAVAQVGVGIQRGSTEMAIVVALQERNLDIDPVPRTLAVGGFLVVAGALRGGHRRPEVIVTTPDGQTHEILTGDNANGVSFRARMRCDRGAGRYQIEVTGENAMGTAVVANFPVFCGTSPPARAPLAAAAQGRALTFVEAEARMLELVNRDRGVARLTPLVLDSRLSGVARGHSHDMADHDFVGHISPTTGNALERVRRAGFMPTLLLENVGRAYSPDEAQAGLMRSPGHRANILDRRVTRTGIGIVYGNPVTGVRPLLVTQLFM